MGTRVGDIVASAATLVVLTTLAPPAAHAQKFRFEATGDAGFGIGDQLWAPIYPLGGTVGLDFEPSDEHAIGLRVHLAFALSSQPLWEGTNGAALVSYRFDSAAALGHTGVFLQVALGVAGWSGCYLGHICGPIGVQAQFQGGLEHVLDPHVSLVTGLGFDVFGADMFLVIPGAHVGIRAG